MLWGVGYNFLRSGEMGTDCWIMATSAEVDVNDWFLCMLRKIINSVVGNNTFCIVIVCNLVFLTLICQFCIKVLYVIETVRIRYVIK